MRGHGRVCPALSAARRSRSSSWQRIATLRRWGHRNILTGAIMELSLILSQAVSLQGVSVVPSPTPTRWTVHLERPTACHRITPFRTSCGRPDPVAGAVCRAMIGCVRNCGRNHPHGRAAGQPCARYGGAAGGWGQASHGRRGATIYSWLDKLYWRLQVPHTYAFRCIWQRQFPAPVLCAGVHHADLLIRWLARAAGGMTGCVRHCGGHDPHRGADAEPYAYSELRWSL